MTLSGPQLDKIVEETAAWYYRTAEKLMKALEEDSHPYGSVRLAPGEQLGLYLSMKPEDWQQIVAKLERRYRGFPNAGKLVEDSLTRYVKRMETLRSQLSGRVPAP